MKWLIAISLTIVIVGLMLFLGPVGRTILGCVLVGLALASPFIIFDYLKKHRPIRTIVWTSGVLVIMVVIGLVVAWWLQPTKNTPLVKSTPKVDVRDSGLPMVQPSEEWVFSHVKKNGRKVPFEVEVTRQEPGLLYLVIQEDCHGTKKNVAGMRLNSSGDDWIGTWVNYLDGDYGEVTLIKQTDNVWSGHYELQDKTTRLCTIRRK